MKTGYILFLDFDGVLHPDAVFLEKRHPVLRTDGQLFMWLPYLIDALTPFPQVQIVLSTSWVRIRGFTRARKVLPDALSQRVIGATWHSKMGRSEHGGFRLPLTWWDRATRYEQIAGYVARSQLSHWLAIDDNNEGWPSEKANHLVLTDPKKGISDPIVLAELQSRLITLGAL